MRQIKCANGHFYDADKYPNGCPHCNKGTGAGPAPGAHTGDDIKTSYINPADVPLPNTTPFPPISLNSGGGNVATGGTKKNDSESNDPKTVSYYYQETYKDNEEITEGMEPVVGWLVCVKGGKFGRDYRLKVGRNFIGRSDEMEVCLKDEPTVSRSRHASIIYEPRQNIFLVQPGDSRELVYLNDQVLLVPSPIKKNDILQVGDISLMLIPCCDDGFKWEDVNKE